MGAEAAGGGRAVPVRLHDHDPGRGQDPQQLDRDLAHPAGAQADDGGVRAGERRQAADRVHRGQPGVGERGQRGRVGPGREPDQGPGRGPEQLGVAAGAAVDAREAPAAAVHVVAPAAAVAVAAGHRRVDDHRVARGQVPHRRADREDVAAVLVPERQREGLGERLGQPAVHDVQVGAAHTGPGHPDHHVLRAGHLRLRHLGDDDRFPVADDLDCAHVFIPLRGWESPG